MHFACSPVNHQHRLPGIIDKQILSGAVRLPHHHIDLAEPTTVVFTEPALLKTLGVGRLVLISKKRQRHTLAFQLLMHH